MENANKIPGRTNYGYGDAGASTSKKSVKGFTAKSGSPQEDIYKHLPTMRSRGRMLYMSTPLATSAVKTSRTNVIGCGLKLKSRIDKEFLCLTPEQADAWEKTTEREFGLWSEKKENCDATGLNDFYDMQQLAYLSWIVSGDVFVLIKHEEPNNFNPYGLRLHIIEADRVSTPWKYSEINSAKKLYDGVEVDKNGKVVAYYICNNYPDSFTLKNDDWIRIPVTGKSTNLPNILHIMDSERPEQYRGVSFLAHIIEPLQQIKQYINAELTAAIVASSFAVFIRKGVNSIDAPVINADAAGQEGKAPRSDPNELDISAGTINVLEDGEDVVFSDPKHPTNGFEDFMKVMGRLIGASTEIPAELLIKAFDASYSASRAALLQAGKSFDMRRAWFANDFCQPVYEIWLHEAIARGRIQAPGFFTDAAVKKAWMGAEWIGPTMGQIDPVKEITAEILAIQEGLTTREQATVRYRGGSWDRNIEQLVHENKLLHGLEENETSEEKYKQLNQILKILGSDEYNGKSKN